MDLVSALQASFAQLIGPSAIFYALLAIGLNLHFGYTGLLNFGQIGFALLGGYGVGIMTVTYQQPLWVGILVGLLAAGALAIVLGIPTLRLRADYLAIATIAAAEVLRLIFRSTASDSALLLERTAPADAASHVVAFEKASRGRFKSSK